MTGCVGLAEGGSRGPYQAFPAGRRAGCLVPWGRTAARPGFPCSASFVRQRGGRRRAAGGCWPELA
jgi:hypothetical protein